MIWLLLRSLVSTFKTRRSLALENLALRQQLAVLQRSVKRPRLSNLDRGLWVLLRRLRQAVEELEFAAGETYLQALDLTEPPRQGGPFYLFIRALCY